MARDIEQRLRQTLQARAEDVTPDPGLYTVVQARIRRGRRMRYALAGATAAAAIAALALAAPALIDRRIEFEPGPVTSQPAADRGGVNPLPPDTDLLYTDGATLFARSADGDVAIVSGDMLRICPDGECDPEPTVAAFDFWAQDNGDFHVAAVQAECAGMTLISVLDEGTHTSTRSGQECANKPVFSPNADTLAWLSRPEDGEWQLHTGRWDAGSLNEVRTTSLPWSGDEHVDIQDWVWTEHSGTSASGYLLLRLERDGVWQLLRMPIQRDVDGRHDVTFDVGLVTTGSAATPVAFAGSGSDVTYTLQVELAPHGPANGTIVRRVGDQPVGAVDVPPELFEAPFEFESLWMSAAGDTVLYGNAEQRLAWLVDWSGGRVESHVLVDRAVVHGVLLPTLSDDVAAPTEQPTTEPTTVQVYFGMSGNDACVAHQPVTRAVRGSGVARGALMTLLRGPSPEERDRGVVSPFGDATAGTLNDIVVIEGEARVDLRDFADDLDDDSCTKSAVVDALDKTLLQFSTITSTRYSFDGDVEAFEQWLGALSEPMPDMPEEVADTAGRIHDAASTRSWRALRRLTHDELACTYSDQPEDCIAYWRSLEEQGEDPLGTLAELLDGPPGHIADADMWVWPAAWADPGSGYSGHRVGIAADGTWRYYNQPGG